MLGQVIVLGLLVCLFASYVVGVARGVIEGIRSINLFFFFTFQIG